MHRFFIPPEWVQGEQARLEGSQARQLSLVLRARRGDQLVLLDNSGWEYHVEVSSFLNGSVQAKVIERRPASPEPSISITIYQGLLKGKKQDWVFQKGTEIGVAAFVPLSCDRCVAVPSEETGNQRWAAVIREAAEQCGRGRLPQILSPRSFNQACIEALRPCFLLSESPSAPSFKEAIQKALQGNPSSVSLFVGPEGGFAPQEVARAEEAGLLPVSLGRRVFRAETAGLIAAAMLLYECGELG